MRENNSNEDQKEGVFMNTVVERHCTIEQSLIESCKQMKLIREGKLKAKSWRELFKEIENENTSDK